MMAGNVLGKGYTAGIGMAIGTAFGRIAGVQAAAAAGFITPSSKAATCSCLIPRRRARYSRPQP